MIRHAPAPWSCSYEAQKNGSLEAFEITDAQGNSILGACSCCNGTYIDGEGKANASLITAAPELLSALLAALPCLGWASASDDELAEEVRLGNGLAEVALICREAIAKAQGADQ